MPTGRDRGTGDESVAASARRGGFGIACDDFGRVAGPRRGGRGVTSGVRLGTSHELATTGLSREDSDKGQHSQPGHPMVGSIRNSVSQPISAGLESPAATGSSRRMNALSNLAIYPKSALCRSGKSGAER